MSDTPIKILLLEDNPDHVDLFISILELTSFHNAVVDNYDSLFVGLELLNKSPYDLVFIDLSLRDSVVTSTLGQLEKIKAVCPVIVITSLDDKQTLLDIIHKGADDCLPKSELNDFTLERIIHYNLDRAALYQKLTHSEASYKDLYHNSPIYHATFDLKTRKIINCNETLAKSLGWKFNHLIGMDVLDIYHADSLKEAEAIHTQLLTSGYDKVENKHLLLAQADGSSRDVLLNISIVNSSGAESDRCHATWVDTTARVRARKEILRLQGIQKQILDAIQDPICLKDLDSNIIACNQSFALLAGKDEEDIIGKNSYSVFPQQLCDEVLPIEEEVITSGVPSKNETWVTSPVSKQQVLLEITKTPLKNDDGTITGVVGYGHDITERHKLTEQLEHSAKHDSLTQLPNRYLFKELFLKEQQRSIRDNSVIAVLFIDLDGFKQINDTFGHDVGDEVLICASKRMKDAIREADIIARQGGDEFLAVLTNLSSPNDAIPLVGRIISTVNEAVVTSKGNSMNPVNISVSIGVTFYEKNGLNLKELLREADDAMYHAKAAGKNCYRIYKQ